MLYRSIDAVQFHRLVTDVFDVVPQSFRDDYDVIATDFLYRSHCLLSLTDKDLTLTLFNTDELLNIAVNLLTNISAYWYAHQRELHLLPCP